MNFKVEILLNEDKIREVGEYTPESIYKAIKDSFADFDLPQVPTYDGTLVFCDKGRDRDYGAFMSLITDLYDADWFKPYVKRYLWYNKKTADTDEQFHIEDIIEELDNFEAKGI